MARRFVKVSEKEIKTAFFYPSDLVNTKTTIPSGSVKSGRYIPRRFASRYYYSPPLRGIVVYYYRLSLPFERGFRRNFY